MCTWRFWCVSSFRSCISGRIGVAVCGREPGVDGRADWSHFHWGQVFGEHCRLGCATVEVAWGGNVLIKRLAAPHFRVGKGDAARRVREQL